MNKKLIYLALFLIVLYSCDKDDNDYNSNIDIVSEKWKVVKVKSSEELSYSYANENYILEFTNDTVYSINLDANNCCGNYKVLSNGKIEIEMAGCTKICCDSEFAENLIPLLSQMKKYYGNNDELIFEGEGTIILEKY